MNTDDPGVLAITIRGLVEAGRSMALPVDDLLAQLGLTRAALADPDLRLPVGAFLQFWRAALAICEGDDFVLRAAEAMPDGAYRILEFLASTSPTVGVGMQRIAKYFPLVTSIVEVEVIEREGARGLRIDAPILSAHPAEAIAISTFCTAILHRNARQHFGAAWHLDAVTFARPRPATADRYDALFGRPVEFDAAHTEMVVAPAVWDAPVPLADPALFAMLDGHAETRLASTDTGIEARVRRALDDAVRGGDPRLPAIASALGMSARTLQRTLKDAAASFSDLQDQARLAAATRYLADKDVSLFEIGYLLGFSDQSAFNRAFKRWTGQTPRAWRLAA
ncbi:MAG: AraC-like DNA-binding protein [Bradymonadia bacterium]|jgi:AraC-like DNA-binding protein